jgi:thiosulfate reductase cytochrome b subunit
VKGLTKQTIKLNIMNFDKMEYYATRIGIYSLLLMTGIGILMVFDIAFDIDFFGNRAKTAAGAFAGLLFLISVSSVILSILLNIKKIVELIKAGDTDKQQ